MKFGIEVSNGEEIPQDEMARIDSSWGDVVSCVCEDDDVVESGYNSKPEYFGVRITVKYANGQQVTAETRLIQPLFQGFVKHYSDSGDYECLVNRRLVATLAKAVAELKPIPKGDVELLSESDAAAAMREYDIPLVPTASRDGIESAWSDVWKKSGKLCELNNGEWLIESVIPESAAGLKTRHYVNGELVNYPGTTEYVELCTGVVKRAVDLTDDEIPLIADPAESDINAGRVDGKAEFERQQREGSGT